MISAERWTWRRCSQILQLTSKSGLGNLTTADVADADAHVDTDVDAHADVDRGAVANANPNADL